MLKRRTLWITIFLLPTSLLFLCIYGIPVVTVIYTSFFKWKGFSGHMNFIGLTNYIEAFKNDATFKKAISNTFIWMILQTTIHVTIGTTLAMILGRKPRGWKFIRASYMIPNIISASALAVIFLNIFNPQYGIINSVLKNIGLSSFTRNWFFDSRTAFNTVTITWLIFAGLITILVLSEIMAIPETIIEASKIDGASDMQINFYITLPLLRNIIGTCVILSATSMLKEFELIFLTTKGGPVDLTLNLPLYLYKTALIENNFGYANTIGTILIALGIISILLISKAFKLGQTDI